jgi:hypothetical protein
VSATVGSTARRLFAEPLAVGDRLLPPLGLSILAAIGAVLLAVVIWYRWIPADDLGDAHAYWLAGQRLLADEALYDPTAGPVTPYAYWYPPIFAQVVAPLSAILPAYVFSLLWGVFLLVCLWWLAGGRIAVGLATIAFIPVAIELWFRNVHIILAVLLVLGVRRTALAFVAGGAIKFGPGTGLAWLVGRGRWRDLMICLVAGAAVLALSYVLSPAAWQQYAEILAGRGGLAAASGLVPVPYGIRVTVAVVLAVVAGRLKPRMGEPLLIVAALLALPTLFPAAFSILVGVVPFLWPRRDGNAPSGGDGAFG